MGKVHIKKREKSPPLLIIYPNLTNEKKGRKNSLGIVFRENKNEKKSTIGKPHDSIFFKDGDQQRIDPNNQRGFPPKGGIYMHRKKQKL